MNQPQLRECMGCGLFQIVPELEPDTRCDCVRCGMTLRRSRRDPLNRGLALNFAALGIDSAGGQALRQPEDDDAAQQ